MAGSFKIPTPIRKPKKDPGLPKFEWKLFEKEKKIGRSTFGSVYLGKYEGKGDKVVTKKINGESIDSQARFVKEAALLNSAKGHRNIIQLLGFSSEPYAIMMEYSSFDFRPFGVEKRVCTLEDFVHFVDAEFDFTSFVDLLPACAKDVVTGLEYLHCKNIAHRDLKPGNILVSNQHYSGTTCDENEFAKAYAECPIICKLADFGLSRSLELQTKSFVMSKTESVSRGTPTYMAPEIHLGRLFQANQDDLKKADMWSVGFSDVQNVESKSSQSLSCRDGASRYVLITIIRLFINTTSYGCST